MRALVKRSGNPKMPAGTVHDIDKVFKKFSSVTFGTFFLVTVDGHQHRCHERRCPLLFGGEWEFIK